MSAPVLRADGVRERRGADGMRERPLVDGLRDQPGEARVPRPSLWRFVQESGLRSLVVGVSKDPNAKITVLLVSPESGRAVLAVKAPTTETAARAVETERHLLDELGRAQGPPVMQTIPRVVDTVDFHGRPAAVMTAVPGVPMTTFYMRWRHTASRGRVAADFAAVGGWLMQFQSATAGPPAPVEMDAGVSSRLRSRFPDDERLEADLDRLAEIHTRLRRDEVPRTAVHGDLWLGNVLLEEGRASGVVDWEGGALSGEPVRDLVRFALMYALYIDRYTRAGRRVRGHNGLRAGRWGAGLEYALGGSGWFPELFRGFLSDGLTRLGASPTAWRDAALAGIAEVAAVTDDGGFARSHLELFRRLAHWPPLEDEVR
jgi:aminoglycoside phosphotransferase (APT) family kinase protein